MSRSLRRGGIAAIVLALSALSLSACADGPGTSSQTLQIKPNSAATSLGNDLKLNAIVVVVGLTQTSSEPGPANLTVNISNTGSAPETLQSVTIGGTNATFQDAKGAPLPGGIVIPAMGAVLVGGPGQPSAHADGATLPVGGFAPTSFAFSSAGKVDVQAQVLPATGAYESFGPATPSASASAPASGSASAGASASAPASAGASTSASAGASGAASAPASGSPASASASAH
ncbi:DUF461 domain-containing protein [Kitasatospora viridis]|uniref:Copper(I)-binding protein n=1 Tax=Kitasatospora viridis TaxID=281105 RepID=A0A561UIM5_9ACTN|nr:DUF461 domain-containing protein [Kitasatospora viridis]TWF99228.1 hypothetical protein FHX73_113069 [Kitasatospora viridis]